MRPHPQIIISISLRQFGNNLDPKFKKSYDLPLDFLQYRRENSAEYLFIFIIQIEIIKINYNNDINQETDRHRLKEL